MRANTKSKSVSELHTDPISSHFFPISSHFFEGAPAADEAAGAATAQNWILQARQLKAQLSAKYSEDDWTPRDYLEAGRRG